MNDTRLRVLIADDQPDVLEALRLLLKAEGYEIEAVATPAAILKAASEREYDAAHATSSRSPGRTRGCSRSSARRASWRGRSVAASVSRKRTAPCVRTRARA